MGERVPGGGGGGKGVEEEREPSQGEGSHRTYKRVPTAFLT